MKRSFLRSHSLFSQPALRGYGCQWKISPAFSLVEVTLAIGIVSFCLVALLGLIPVGLTAVKTAREEAAAGNCLNYLAAAIRKARADSTGTNYVVLGAFSNVLFWSEGGPNCNATLSSISLGGTPASNAIDKRLVARIEIQPPANSTSTGLARISVAWPQNATWTTSWQNAQGNVCTSLVFLSPK